MNLNITNNFFRSVIPSMEDAYVDWPYRDPPLIKPYPFEIFDLTASRKWFWANWTLTLYISLAYVILIHLGQYAMKSRPAFNLRPILTLWNFGLALFSATALVRVLPEFYAVLQGPNGFHRSVCVRDELNPSSAWWAMAFSVSKLVELLDTLFIVLRKTPLIFLHWYHHMATLIVCWMSYPQAEPIFRYVGIMNLGVHSIMYCYYGFKAMKFNPPRRLSMMITILQLSQMVIGLIVNLYAIYAKNAGMPCARSDENIRVQMGIYASYLALFLNYFYHSYVSSKKKFKSS